MAAKAQQTQEVEQWLPEGVDPPEQGGDGSAQASPKRGASDTEAWGVEVERETTTPPAPGADEWVPNRTPPEATPADASNGDEPQAQRPASTNGEAVIRDLEQRARLADSAIREAEARVKEADQRARLASGTANRLETQVTALTERLKAQEQALEHHRQEAARNEARWRSFTERAKSVESSLSETSGTPVTAAPVAKPENRDPRSPDDLLDLNSASFEELRGVGLSVTQAARLISQRDSRGGFSSKEELDGLYGFPNETLEALKAATRL